ncbi:acetylserotonin O-methyltransferase [Saccharothrix luteola]|uniref:acetylserotonin O-methyltransferase n=1 Tax=Saccharothrix luteola TaxID=2893018 RepID=UPI001E2F4D61|nr:acetylserotonin O-methyltransferase [Saccharothrix luteola]MCC8246732.1 acetylserotonin O-methyltransferase [Saccharothrix luteola]
MGQDTITEARRALMNMIFGSMASQVVSACVRLGVADPLGEAELCTPEVASTCGTPVGTTRRLLRAATALGLAVDRGGDRFALTPMGAMLRSGGEGSPHTFARVFTDPVMVRPWHRLDEAVIGDRTTFEDEFGVPFFDHLKTAPDLAAAFNAAMSQGTHLAAAALPEAYDFGRFGAVMDVGGGDGTLRATGVASRCAVRTGDFFTSFPGGVDAILLKSVLHDWDDERATTILGHCRQALPDHGRLLVVEPVLPEAVADALSPVVYLSDLNMPVNVGGRERTRAEFETLLSGNGFTVDDVIPLPPSGFCLIEATCS